MVSVIELNYVFNPYSEIFLRKMKRKIHIVTRANSDDNDLFVIKTFLHPKNIERFCLIQLVIEPVIQNYKSYDECIIRA